MPASRKTTRLFIINFMKKSFYLIIILLSISCRSNKPQESFYKGELVEELKRVETPFTTLDLIDGVKVDYGDIVDDIRYLQLGREKGLIGEIAQILYCKDKYYMFDKAQDMVFIFDSNTGRCVHKINSKGRGPKEYLSINNIDINKEAEELIVVDRLADQVLFYDLEGDYKYKRSISIQRTGMLWLRDSTFVYSISSHQNSAIDALNGYGIIVATGDSIQRTGFQYLPSQIGYAGDRDNLKRFCDDVIYYRPLYSDSIYRINPDLTYSVAWHAKLNNSAWERNSNAKDFVVDMGSKRESRIYSWFFENNDFFVGYARIAPSLNSTMDIYLYDKARQITYLTDTKQYDNITKLDRFYGYDILGVSGQYFISVASFDIIETTGIREKIENGMLEVTDPSLRTIVNTINHNDNPFLILTKFKSL